MDKNKLYVVQTNEHVHKGLLSKGTLVRLLYEKGIRAVAKDLQIVPTCGNGEWAIEKRDLKLLEHKFNVGDRVMTIDGLYGAGTVIFVGTMSAFDLSGSINEPCYIVKLDERKSSYLPFFHKGTNKYFKGTKENVCYYFTEFELSKIEDKQSEKIAEKSKFKVGDRICCMESSKYNLTSTNVICEVTKLLDQKNIFHDDLEVQIVKQIKPHKDKAYDVKQKVSIFERQKFSVKSKYFGLCREELTKDISPVMTIWRVGNIVYCSNGLKTTHAKCNETDTFDFYIGANIALLRFLKGVK